MEGYREISKIVNRSEQKTRTRNKYLASFKLESVKVHNVMEKDIIFIYFWPDAEALRINLWNILQKEKRERGKKKKLVIRVLLCSNGTRFCF